MPAFSYDFLFASAEYGQRVCSPYNDFFLLLYQTATPGIPPDGNIAFDAMNNLVSVNNVFFQRCSPQGCSICPSGAGKLTGTGMDLGSLGAATEWLTVDVPVLPGEVMQLDLMIFDVTDSAGDSLVLLDNFRWWKPNFDPCGHHGCNP
jgi:hypothetical protein